MSKETTALKNMIEERRVKIKQTAVLQVKETEKMEEAAKIGELLQQAKKTHDSCLLANLAGTASDQDLKESKTSLKELSDSLQETKEALQFISEARRKLNLEIGTLNGDILVHRGALCRKLAESVFAETGMDKKLKEKLISGCAAFQMTGDFDMSWQRFLVLCFPQPSDGDMQLAAEKLKTNNDFMQD